MIVVIYILRGPLTGVSEGLWNDLLNVRQSFSYIAEILHL